MAHKNKRLLTLRSFIGLVGVFRVEWSFIGFVGCSRYARYTIGLVGFCRVEKVYKGP